jgi:DNA helicase II / ATP-dependent DNA helicase PcrA
MSQTDKSRIQKTLNAMHPAGPKPTLYNFRSDQQEAASIAFELKRLVARSGGTIGYNDIGILRQ